MSLLFSTQLAPPRGPRHLIDRPRLRRAIVANLDRRLITIVAPPGAGKSSLLVDVVKQIDRPWAWLTLDEWLRDPVELVSAIAAAVEPRAAGVQLHVQSALAAGGSESVRVRRALVALVETLAEAPKGVLIVDDIHHTGDDPRTLDVLDALIKRAPDGWCILLTGRWLPSVPAIDASTVDGEHYGLESAHLALTFDETIALAVAVSGGPVDEAKAELIWEQTRGWAAAVVIQAQAPHFGAADARSTESTTPGTTATTDYFSFLAARLLAELPEREQEMLFRVAIPRRIDGEIYTRLMRGIVTSEAAPMPSLEALARRHVFINPVARQGAANFTSVGMRGAASVPAKSPCFRMHDLFREFLLVEGTRRMPDLIQRIHVVAGGYAEANLETTEAIYHFRQAADWPSLGRVVRARASSLRGEGRWQAVVDLIDSLPAAVLDVDPAIGLPRAEALCYLAHVDDALAYLLALWPRLQAPEHRMALAQALVERGSVHRFAGNHDAAVADTRSGYEQLVALDAPEALRARAARLHAVALAARGDSAAAIVLLQGALASFETLGDPNERSLAHDSIAVALERMGETARAAQHLEQARLGWHTLGNRNALALTLNNLGATLVDLGDLDAAEEVLIQAQRLAEEHENQRIAVGALLSRAEARRERQDGDGMADLAAQALQQARASGNPFHAAFALISLSEAHRLLGDLARAETYAHQAISVAEEQAGRFELGIAWRALGRALLDHRDVAGSARHLRLALAVFEELGLQREAIRTRFPLAAALFRDALHRDEALKMLDSTANAAQSRQMLALLRREAAEHPDLFAAALTWFPKQSHRHGPAKGALSVTPAVMAANGGHHAYPAVSVRLLGRTQVFMDGREVGDEKWATDKARELLFFLLANPGLASSVDLATALWPDSPDRSGRGALYTTVARLKRALYPDCVVRSRDGYQLNPRGSFWLDASEFQSLTEVSLTADMDERRGKLERAIALYAGPISSSALPGEWAEPLRTRCEQRYLASLADLAGYYYRRGQAARAIDIASKVVLIDRYAEPMVRLIFESHLLNGNLAEALHAYQNYRRRMAAEGIAPADDFTERFRQVRSGDYAPLAV